MLSASGLAAVTLSCGGARSAAEPAGVQAQHLNSLWWLFFFVCAVVYLAVMAVLSIAFIRAKKAGAETGPETHPDPGKEKRMGNIVKIAVGISLVEISRRQSGVHFK